MENMKQLATDAQTQADLELRVRMCDAEIRAVLEKYALGFAFQEVRVNGQVTSAQFILLPVAPKPLDPGRVLNG